MANDRPRIQQELLRPQATPVSTYTGPPRSGLRDLAASLSGIDRELDTFIKDRAEKFRAEEAIRGEAAFQKNNSVGYAEGVRTGAIPAQASGSFMRAYKQSEGALAGQKLKDAYGRAYAAWDGKFSEDPEAYDEFISNFVKQNIGTDDPDILRGLLPHLREVEQNGYAKHTADVSDSLYKGSLDSHVAQANRDIEEGSAEGLVSGEGTDYPAVFAAVEVRREAFVAAGGDPADFDKTMIDAMSAKVLSTRDTGLLAWFDQKVPGADYTYGESPYGQKIKDQTVASLEVINRQNMTGEAAAQKKLDDAAKDKAWQDAIDILADDPAAALPDELVDRGRKYDPKFLVNIEEWRKSFDGFTDPQALREVYSDVLAGGGTKAVRDAASRGAFGKMSDMVAAMNFAKGYEDNKGRIEETLSSGAAKSIINAIDTRTKGTDTLGQPLGGTSNEGFEAQYDFKRMVQEWVVNNPDATLMEREEAISKIGEVVLRNIPQPDPLQPGVYNQPPELSGKFNNPFSPQAPAEAPAQAPAPAAPPAQPAADAAGPAPTITPEQMRAVDDLAQTRGVSPEVILQEMGIAPPAEAPAGDEAPQAEPVGPDTRVSPAPGAPGPDQDASVLKKEVYDPMLKGIEEQPEVNPDAASQQPGAEASDRKDVIRPWFRKLLDAEEAARAKPISYEPGDEGDEGGGDERAADMTFEQAQSILDEAIASSSSGAQIPEGGVGGYLKVTDPFAANLAHFISKYEAAGNYNAVYGNARSDVDLSQFTLDGILQQQRAARKAGKKSTAIGAGQFIYKTLKSLKSELGLKGSEAFTPQLQDRLMYALMVRRGLEQYKAGTISKKTFARRLSQEWAALPNPDTGRSYYHGDGLNASGVSTARVYRALGFSGSAGSATPVSLDVPAAYANIPAGEVEQFKEWNPDPVANHEQTLSTIEPTLAGVVRRAQELASVKFVAGSGKREKDLQKKAKAWGWSKTEDSDHLHGGAVDLWPLDEKGAVTFTEAEQLAIVDAMQQAATEMGVELDIGANWRSGKDLPHFGLKKTKKKTKKERTA